MFTTQAMAIKNSIGGICGFVSALVAGRIVSHIRAADNMLFGLNVLPQQVLSVISFVLAVAVVLYIKLEIEKEKIKTKVVLEVKDKYGKNAILKGLDYEEKATQKERNLSIGGHKSGEKN